MQENYYVGAYWGARKETALECARRAEQFFHMLARCDQSFVQWYRAGRGASRELPGYPVHPEVKELEEMFLRSRVHVGPGKVEVIEDLGFGRHMWNGKKESSLLNLHCGEYSPWGSGNVCLLSPPRSGAVKERLLRVPVLAEILTSMATAWEPDFAMATSDEMVDVVEKRKREVRVGWLTYLSNRLGKVPPLPEPVRV
ncbi:MAG TPA: Imm52 family immunity protein, partial [Myxococcaceae bacterium]|nr:Imm52 family immunity protein [Myxococcaceae bacterium]